MQYWLFAFLTGLYALCLANIPFSPITFILGLPLGVWLSNVLHETAHLLSYLCLRIPWRRLRISCFVLHHESGALRFNLDRHSGLYMAECTCLYEEDIPHWKYCIALLNGGLACALACPIALCLSLPLTGPDDSCLCGIGLAFGLNAMMNLLNPRSADRLLIKRFWKEGKVF